jgi:peptidoglycan hydrolase-like protein with peptidoglycan-binding domain
MNKTFIGVLAVAIVIAATGTAQAFTIGDTGSEVSRLQVTLLEAGYDIPALSSGRASFGYFGEQTQAALAKYEASQGLTLGAAASATDFPKHASFNQGITVGGRVATTTTAATYTTAEKDFRGQQSYWDVTPNLNTTISLTSTSTFPLVPNVGDIARVIVRNASSTAGATITFAAANANVDLQFSEATGGDLVLNGLDFAELIIIRESALLTSVIFNEFTEAD